MRGDARKWLVAMLAAMLLVPACNPTNRYKTLSLFFDGVPVPPTPEELAAAAKLAAQPSTALRPIRTFAEHGPYAAKQCGACHESVSSNQYVRPKDELCTYCHSIPKKKIVHDPFDSNECLECHDPHSGRYPGILVNEVNAVCHGCHDAETLAGTDEHADTSVACTKCHDPHTSDKGALLR